MMKKAGNISHCIQNISGLISIQHPLKDVIDLNLGPNMQTLP